MRDKQYLKFCTYGFLKNLRLFDAFLLLFLLEKGLTYTQIGFLYTIREVIINVFEIPSGIFADTYGRKKALMSSFLFYIASFLFYSISTNFFLFLLAFILFGVGDAFRSGTHKGIIMDYLKLKHWEDKKILYYGYTRSWSQRGSAISSLIAGLIVFHHGNYQNIFIYSMIPYIFNFLLIYSYPKELDIIKPSKETKHFHRLHSTIKTFFTIIKDQKVLKIVSTSAFHTAYLKAIKDYIQPLLISLTMIIPIFSDYDIEKKNGVTIGIIYFLIYILTSFASQYSSKFVTKQSQYLPLITLIFGFSFGIISGIFYNNNHIILATLAFVGIYIIENIRKPILTGFVSDHVPNEILASVVSAQSQIKTIITAIITISLGVLADRLNLGYSIMIVSISLLTLTLILNFFITPKSK